MNLDPVAVALKFGFIAVLYLFLLWVARSALRDLRSTGTAAMPDYDEGTGMHPPGGARAGRRPPTTTRRPGGIPPVRRWPTRGEGSRACGCAPAPDCRRGPPTT